MATGRKLGNLENFLHYLTGTFGVEEYIHVAVINASCQIDQGDVEAACQALARKQQALQMRIVKSTTEVGEVSYEFQPMDDPTKVTVFTRPVANKNQWVALVKDEEVSTIDCINGPLWGLVFAPVNCPLDIDAEEICVFQYVVVFRMHHAIADGKSVFDMIQNQLIPILSRIKSGESFEDLTGTIPLCRSIDQLITQKENKPIWHQQRTSKVKQILQSKPRKLSWKFPKEDLSEGPGVKPASYPVVFSRGLSKSLIKAAKMHDVSAHSVLLATSSAALSQTAVEAKLKLPKTFTQNWPIDMRKYLAFTSPEPLGALVGNGLTTCRRTGELPHEEFWCMCKDIYRNINVQVEASRKQQPFNITEKFRGASDMDTLSATFEEIGFVVTAVISNIGNCDHALINPGLTHSAMDISLQEHFFSITGLSRIDTAAFFNTMSTFNGRLMWNCLYNARRVSYRVVQTYMKHIENILQAYCF